MKKLYLLIGPKGSGKTHLGELIAANTSIYINVWAELETCMQRIKNRDASRQIPVEEERIREYNEKVAAADHDWDLVIDNNGPASAGEILAQIGTIE